MKPIDKMPVWETLRRLNMLIRFRELGSDYFGNTEMGFMHTLSENEIALQARSEMNLLLQSVHDSVILAGITPVLTWNPQAGYVRHFDVLAELFELNSLGIEPRRVEDILTRAIGVYQDDLPKARIRTLNPLFWLFLLLEFLVSIPFRLLGAAGFSRSRMESSFLGRLFKAALYLITALVGCTWTVVQILDKLGHLDLAKRLFDKLLR